MYSTETIDVIRKLSDFNAQLSSITNIKTLGEEVERAIESLIPVEYTGLYLFDPFEKKLKLLSARGFSEEEKKEAEATAMKRHPGWVFRNKRVLYIPDAETETDNISSSSKRSFVVKSRLYVPVFNKEECIGTFGITSAERDKYTEEHVTLLTYIGNIAGFVYNNILNLNRISGTQEMLRLFERALESAKNGVVITDPTKKDNPIIYVNDAYTKITGYAREESIGKNCRFLQGNETDQSELEVLRESIREKKGCTVALRNFRKNGDVFWNELSISPIRDENGKTTHFIGIQNDVTNRVSYESEIIRSTTRMTSLIQNLHAGVLVEDENRKIVLINDEFKKLFSIDYSTESMIGMDCSKSADEMKFLFLDPETFVDKINEILIKKLQVQGDELKLKDGRVFKRDYIPIFIEEQYQGHLWLYRDITYRRNAEDKLIESEARYRQIVDEASDIIYRTDDKGFFTFVNPIASAVVGYSREELIGKHYSELAREDFRDQLRKFYRNQVRDRIESTYFEFPLITKSNKEVWIGQKVELIFNANLLVGFQAVARDITSKIMYEKEIQLLRQFYEQVLNDLPGQIAVFDSDFRYLYLNPASVKDDDLRLWLIGKNDFEYCEYRNYDISLAVDRQNKLKIVKDKKKHVAFEEVIKTRTGETRYFIREISPILDELGNVRQLLAYGIDITEKIVANQELDKSKKQLASVLETVAEGIVTIDENSIIVMANEEVEKIWGYTKNELIGKKATILMPLKYRELHNDGMERYQKTKVPHVLNKKLELEALRKDGTIFPIEITIKETTIGNESYYIAAIHDITEMKNLLSKLESSNKSLSEFAYIASHDLREPLRKISSFGGLLKETIRLKLDEDETENLNYMIDGAKRMRQMIDDLLSYSRITSAVDRSHKIDLDMIVREVIDFELAASIEESQAEIILENSLGTIRGDKTQINQLFQNIISNGIKYRNREIKPIIRISSENQIKFIRINIEDNGIGIEEKYFKQIFEMFKRLHSREQYSGSGIGLSICKRIVEMYGGEIGVESKIGVGTKFWFTLPRIN